MTLLQTLSWIALAFLTGYILGEWRRDWIWVRTARRPHNILWISGKRYRVQQQD